MKKPLIALSIVCASALALADTAQPYDSWFTGIGSGASISAMNAENGTWTFPTTDGAAKIESGALVLNLDKDDAGNAEEATFTIADSSGIGATQVLTVTGVFAPIAKDDLLLGAAMTTKGAQVGFAVVTEDSGNSFYAWVGATGGDDASANWQKLFTAEADAANAAALATDADGEKTLTITLSYNPSEVTATFAVAGTVTTTAEDATESTSAVTVTSEAIGLTGGAKTVAETKKAIASVSCTGSGTLSALNGSGNYAVAEADGWKFDTASDAIAAAQATGGSGNVILRRDVNGEVSVSGGLRLHYDTSVSGRNQNIQENFKIAESSAQTKVTSNAGSPLIEGWGYKEWALPNDVLLDVKINDRQIGSQTGIFAGDFNSKFTDWLMNNCSASRESAATAATVQEALTGTTGKNGYLLWQSYVMGVDADEAVKLAPATTDAEDGIALTLTSTIPDSPFASAIKYTVYKDGTSVGEATSIGTRTSPVVKIPLATGKYSVSFTIE